MTQPDRIYRKMRMVKSVRLVNCRFVAKPSLSLEVFAGTGRSKQIKWAIMRTAGNGRLHSSLFSDMLVSMKLNINPRENGACPICVFHNKCRIQNALKASIEEMHKGQELEVVIYTCPRFKEKF
jgi:hypothetical protein